ncbi:proline dehydrogenase family protein [Paenibacillus doosanensis]|uniref:proline dehydrogenase family protein n=1 Tax=Paenibacillus doosanensis TaxID=1229154 RepID=UPI00218082D7|nr:proline dehydrogenase family protein [Paenibacillus doosanensis]MCS7460431.1 proline dehydrogenase family protein [Paenibacillus doosanensis]
MNAWFRRTVLRVAELRRVKSTFERYGMRMGVRRFVAAETLTGALERVRDMNRQGLAATLDYLGESVEDPLVAEKAANQIIEMLRMIDERKLDANVSLKLTQLGCLLDPDACLKHMERIAAAAGYYRNFVRIDMEDSTLTDLTLGMTGKLVERFGHEHVGTVLQAYLYRSPGDLKRLGEWKSNVRIVKGAYKEDARIAFPQKRDVDRQYVEMVKAHMNAGHYTAVATHDARIIQTVKSYAAGKGISSKRFEFQMLYGIAGGLQRQLADQGYRVRIYTPFGSEWYPYFTRRIAERPANLLFVLKGMLRK